jgi:hypothetical protein
MWLDGAMAIISYTTVSKYEHHSAHQGIALSVGDQVIDIYKEGSQNDAPRFGYTLGTVIGFATDNAYFTVVRWNNKTVTQTLSYHLHITRMANR